MKIRLLIGLVIAAAAVIAIVLMAGNRDDESDTPEKRGSSRPVAERGHVEVTWPESFDEDDRAVLRPRIDALVGDDEEVVVALSGLAATETLERFADRSRDLLGLLHFFLDELLREASDPVRRSVVNLLTVWVAAAEGEARDPLTEAIPLQALGAAFGSTEDELLLRETLRLVAIVPGPAALRLLLRAVPHESPAVRRETMRALARRDDPTARGAMRKRLTEDPDAGVKAEILSLWMGRAAYRPEDLPALVRPFVNADETVLRVAAIDLVGVMLDRQSLPGLGAALARNDRDTTLAVVTALGRLGGPEAGRVLENVEDPGEKDKELSRQIQWARKRCQ